MGGNDTHYHIHTLETSIHHCNLISENVYVDSSISLHLLIYDYDIAVHKSLLQQRRQRKLQTVTSGSPGLAATCGLRNSKPSAVCMARYV